MDANLRQPLVVGNWKMHNDIPGSIKLITALKNMMGDMKDVEVAVAPPFTSLYSASIAIQETPLRLAAQNCFWEEEGPYTGEVSAVFLKDMGCHYVILGHSERRRFFAETDEIVNRKIHAVLNTEIIPIFCIGETEKERKEGLTFQVIERQIKRGLLDIGMHDLTDFIIAYEPVWAIGTGHTATTQQIDEVHSTIRSLLAKLYDAPMANKIRILYGGSVKSSNIAEIMKIHHVDGVLVGGASLNAEEFSKIIHFSNLTKLS